MRAPRRRPSWLWWSMATALLVAGGVAAVLSSRPAKAPAAQDVASAQDPHRNWQSQLPPGHPDISGMMPHAAGPLAPGQEQAAECPFLADPKAKPASLPKT